MHLTTGRGARVAALGLALLAFAGCGDDDDPAAPVVPTNQPPTVNAGADASVTAGESVALAATVTDAEGDAVTHAWSLVSAPAGSAATLAADAPLSTTLQTDVEGTYVVRLTANDPTSSAFDERVITAQSPFTGGAVSGTEATAGAELTEIANRLHAVLKGGWNNQSPQNVAKSLAGLDATNTRGTYSIVDVRLAEDYAAGHIPGAINIPLAQLPAVLLANPNFPESAAPTRKLIIAGYNAGDSTMGAYLANNARWTGDSSADPATAVPKPAYALQYGMSGWTFDLQASPTRFDDDVNVRRYAAGTTEASAVPTTPVHGYTHIAAFTGTSTTNQKVLVRARAFLKSLVDEAAATGVPAREAMWTTFVKLEALRKDGDTSNDPQVVDVRGASNYVTGHVPGAIFIPYQQVARLVRTDEALTGVAGGATVTPAQPTTPLVDPTRTVFVHCVTGHTGGHATMALGILGYKVRNLLYGMNGWTESTAVGGGAMVNFDASASGNDFPLTTGTDCRLLDGTSGSGTSMTFTSTACQAAYSPSRSGCTSCHENYLAHFSEVTAKPIGGAAPPVASEGEG